MNIPDSPQLRTVLLVVTLGVTLVGWGVGVGVFQSQLTAQTATAVRLERLIEQNTESGRSRDVEIRALQLGAGRVDERLINILTGINEIKRQLEVRP